MILDRRCEVCRYIPILDGNKAVQVRVDRRCGAWWFCSLDCHKRFHGLGPNAPDLDQITYECEFGEAG